MRARSDRLEPWITTVSFLPASRLLLPALVQSSITSISSGAHRPPEQESLRRVTPSSRNCCCW